jgi:arylsulfatase A-like enzyme
MHGSFSPRDVHNVLIASGPAFRPDFHRDELPSANVDVAPTIASILGIALPSADGRALDEALRGAKGQPQRLPDEVRRPAQSAQGLEVAAPAASHYSIELHTSRVRQNGREFGYFDSATALRY